MFGNRRFLHIALVTLEARSALSVTGGAEEGTFDTVLRKDANGLPGIPGSAIAGVLRSLWRLHVNDAARERDLFGTAGSGPGAAGVAVEEQASRVETSWAVLHDSQNQPATRQLLPDAMDPVLQDWLSLARPAEAVRERVRLTHRGAAAHGGQFDRRVAIAGSRFTFELALWSDEAGAGGRDWRDLCALLRSPFLAFGGAVRSGYGRMALIAFEGRRFDFSEALERGSFASLRSVLHAMTPGCLSEDLAQRIAPPSTIGREVTLLLRSEALLRMGGGTAPIGHYGRNDIPKLLFAHEDVWDWRGRTAARKRHLLIAASAIKGALRQRVEFHASRFAERWAEELAPDDPAWANEEAISLFGERKRRGGGHAGRLLIDDISLDPDGQPQDEDRGLGVEALTHNAIDRFTGGVRRGALFAEEMVRNIEFEVRLRLLPARADDRHGAAAERALEAALDDLRRGWLPIGAAAGRGHGTLKGGGRG